MVTLRAQPVALKPKSQQQSGKMHEKRYSVFISSTFEDLKEERRAIQDVVISAGDFPVQMESFPAADVDQFEFIKSLIDKCDFYILIVAGRYGTPAADGESYTEKEYHYAVSKNIPVLVMLHGKIDEIAASKSEQSPEGRKRLADFIKKIQTNRLRQTWTTTDQLKLRIREALDHAKATKKAVGWIRGDAVATIDALEELAEVRKENARYRDLIGELQVEIELPPIPSGSDEVEIELLPVSVRPHLSASVSGTYANLRTTWIGAFSIFYSNLKWRYSDWENDAGFHIDEDESCDALGAAFAGELADFNTENLFRLKKGTFEKLQSYYTEVGLMCTEGATPFTAAAHRVARRHRINGSKETLLKLMSGKIQKIYENHPTDDSEDIPF